MRLLKWSVSHAAFVTEIDDEHREIFAAVSNLQMALSDRCPTTEMEGLAQGLATHLGEHFAHEERLMRAARYNAARWHKEQHDHAR